MSRLSATWHHGTSRLSCAAALEVPLLLYSSAAHVRPIAAAFCLLLLPPVSAAASASASDLQQQALYRGEKPAQRARLHHEPQLRDALQTRDGEHDGVLKTHKRTGRRANARHRSAWGVDRAAVARHLGVRRLDHVARHIRHAIRAQRELDTERAAPCNRQRDQKPLGRGVTQRGAAPSRLTQHGVCTDPHMDPPRQ